MKRTAATSAGKSIASHQNQLFNKRKIEDVRLNRVDSLLLPVVHGHSYVDLNGVTPDIHWQNHTPYIEVIFTNSTLGGSEMVLGDLFSAHCGIVLSMQWHGGAYTTHGTAAW